MYHFIHIYIYVYTISASFYHPTSSSPVHSEATTSSKRRICLQYQQEPTGYPTRVDGGEHHLFVQWRNSSLLSTFIVDLPIKNGGFLQRFSIVRLVYGPFFFVFPLNMFEPTTLGSQWDATMYQFWAN